MTYTATLHHHSIARCRTVSAETLTACKRAATREFGDGYLDHEIVIYDDAHDYAVSRRRLDERRWRDAL